MSAPLLRVEGLRTVFDTPAGRVVAVDGASFDIGAGETLGLVGESGCGKTVCAMSVVRLVPSPPGRIEAGELEFGGRRLDRLPVRDLWAVRGREIGLVFQEPMSSLNPVHRVGRQLAEAVLLHTDASPAAARERALEMLGRVGIPSPERCLDRYPHELSGGMQQRVMIAMAMMLSPRLLIADEPTTALDVTIQAQILALIARLQRELGMAVLLITHDLGIVAEAARRVVVMYASRVVEAGPVAAVFKEPLHPYTGGLIRSIPAMHEGEGDLPSIPGAVPSPLEYPAGCHFAPRCPLAEARCLREKPALREVRPGRRVACFVRERPAGGGHA